MIKNKYSRKYALFHKQYQIASLWFFPLLKREFKALRLFVSHTRILNMFSIITVRAKLHLRCGEQESVGVELPSGK